MSKAHRQADTLRDETEAPGRKVRPHVLSPEAQKWRAENAEAAKAWAEWIEKNGPPLEEYRMF